MLAWPAMDSAREPSPGGLGAGALLVGLAIALSLGTAVFAGGASGATGTLPVGGLAVLILAAALVAVALGRLPTPDLGRSGALLVASVVALVVWTGASVAWSIVPDRSWEAFNKAVGFAAFLGLGLFFAVRFGHVAARSLAIILSAVVGATLGWALLTKALPSLDVEGARIARLNEPVDYWNALALLADAGIALGLWLGGAWTRSGLRAAGALLVHASALALALSLSRIGLATACLVIAFCLALAERRAEAAVRLAASSAPALPVALWTYTRPALVDDGLEAAARQGDAALFGALALVGAAAAVGLALRASRRPLGEAARRRVERALAASGVLLAVLAVGVVGVAVASAVTSEASCAEVTNDPRRLRSADLNSRLCWWGEALDVFAGNAPLGAGAGTFEIARKRYRADARSVSQPHSVPLQQLADGGLVALGLWCLLVGAAAGTVACALRRVTGPERSAAVALAALSLAYGAHSLVDFDWDFLAVTAPTMLVLGTLAAAGRAPSARRRRVPLAVAAVLATSAVLVSLASPQIADRDVRASTSALLENDLEQAERRALRARRWDPLAVEPVLALARVEEARGDLEAAERRYVQAVELQPENPETWYALGLFELEARNRPCAGYRFLNEAYTLDPAGRQWVPGGPLDVARDAVNAGACE